MSAALTVPTIPSTGRRRLHPGRVLHGHQPRLVTLPCSVLGVRNKRVSVEQSVGLRPVSRVEVMVGVRDEASKLDIDILQSRTPIPNPSHFHGASPTQQSPEAAGDRSCVVNAGLERLHDGLPGIFLLCLLGHLHPLELLQRPHGESCEQSREREPRGAVTHREIRSHARLYLLTLMREQDKLFLSCYSSNDEDVSSFKILEWPLWYIW